MTWRAWVILSILALLMLLGAGVFYVLWPGEPPKPDAHYFDWVEQKLADEGRLGDSYLHLERAMELYEPLEKQWDNQPDEFFGDEFGLPVDFYILLGPAPREDRIYLGAVAQMKIVRDAGVLDEIRRHRETGAGIPPFDRTSPPEKQQHRMEHFKHDRIASELCLANARLAAIAENWPEMLDSLADVHALGMSAVSDRSSIGQIVRLSIHEKLWNEVRFLLAEFQFPPDVLHQLLDLASEDSPYVFSELIEAERRFSATQDQRDDYGTGWGYRRYRAQYAEVLEALGTRTAVEVWSVPPPVATENFLDRLDQPDDQLHVMSLQSVLARLAKGSVQDSVDRAGTACLIAVELYRAKHGTLPASLPEAFADASEDPSLALDPAWNTPFVYARHSSSPLVCKLYAVGDNIDDGGAFPNFGHFEALSRTPVGLDINFIRSRPPIADEHVGSRPAPG